jgi:hypothetical protein
LDSILAVSNTLRQALFKPAAGTFWAFLRIDEQIAVHKNQRGVITDNGTAIMRTFKAAYNYKTVFTIHKTLLFSLLKHAFPHTASFF